MQKKGQVSVFIVLGIVAIAAVVFVFILFRSFEEKARGTVNTEEYLGSQLGDIKREIEECIFSSADAALDKLYENGGILNPVRYADYYGKKITYLCYNVEDNEPCYNMMFTKNDFVNQLSSELESNIPACISDKLVSFRDQDYSVNVGEFFMDDPIFNERELVVYVNYPVTLTRGNVTDRHDEYVVSIDTNFLKVINLVSDIVNMHARGEAVSVVDLSSGNLNFEIGRTSASSGALYIIKPRYGGEDRIFYFAVET